MVQSTAKIPVTTMLHIQTIDTKAQMIVQSTPKMPVTKPNGQTTDARLPAMLQGAPHNRD